MNAVPQTNGDGLGLGDLRLVPSDPAWPETFRKESARLLTVPHVITIEHIGSTTFSDILSKPVVDIAVMVDTQPNHPSIRESFTRLGYTHRGEYGLPGRIFYTLGDPPFVHIHVVTCGSSYWSDWLTFRNFLLHHPNWRKRYEIEKQRILACCNGDRTVYTSMKSPFIQHVLNVAQNETDDDKPE
jgi:GrpB-like predicted nucleotidyltransferase (UPF0157 family)